MYLANVLKYFLIVVVTLLASMADFSFPFCFADVSLSKKAKETCPSTDPNCKLSNEREGDYRLYQIDGVETGFVQHVKLQGISYKIITRSMKPLLFEIPDFLSENECDRIVQLANQEGLMDSGTLDTGYDDFGFRNETNHDSDESDSSENESQCKEFMDSFDKSSDRKLNAEELKPFFDMYSTVRFKENDIRSLLLKLGFDKDKDGELSYRECLKANVSALEDYIDNIESSDPLYKTRYSQQAWLSVNNDSDPVLVLLQQRITELTKLPREMIENSEHLQVVRYSVYGHFHAHYDSSFKKDKPCCIKNEEQGDTCNLCRYATILYYLNNVPEGGETAFPIADNVTYDEEEYQKKGLDNLSTRCHDSNIVVKPKKGTAILWYNHHLDPSTGGMGTMDKYSLHGGCDVKKGIKWIANNWINALHMHYK
ncbi:transmembrane prolyl 4-hydroxylase isoform X2 [Exaiptasia diaphana]|uniref:Transmembrane prolyl 4-hydroxylase n=1 Tax=Exaiptasia diaphana TaxID=2652724 RepID=A0A913Y6J8_EXADI|nr:transmembrane prolyl 4-hydroxylase isoform X1 [Exaiptasia diaphana]XP_020915534.1 transmembrane prolyl 4-hydroxylase isoform X2 [Exaiptasia diaphana]KXJ22138.1 Transmembrane prolyl 4-hydroxylase [Exaiptasia diaphana]